MAAGGFLERWAHDEQLLVEQGNDLEIVFRDGQRNKRQVKPPFVQTGNHLFRYPDGNADLGMREPAAQLPERPAELVDERGDAGREMKRTRVLGDVILKFLLDVAHQPDEFPGTFREARGGGGGHPVPAPARGSAGVARRLGGPTSRDSPSG